MFLVVYVSSNVPCTALKDVLSLVIISQTRRLKAVAMNSYRAMSFSLAVFPVIYVAIWQLCLPFTMACLCFRMTLSFVGLRAQAQQSAVISTDLTPIVGPVSSSSSKSLIVAVEFKIGRNRTHSEMAQPSSVTKADMSVRCLCTDCVQPLDTIYRRQIRSQDS